MLIRNDSSSAQSLGFFRIIKIFHNIPYANPGNLRAYRASAWSSIPTDFHPCRTPTITSKNLPHTPKARR
jgi:hypothetical protein